MGNNSDFGPQHPSNWSNGETPIGAPNPPDGRGNPIPAGFWIDDWDSEFWSFYGYLYVRHAYIPAGDITVGRRPTDQFVPALCTKQCPNAVDLENHQSKYIATESTTVTVQLQIQIGDKVLSQLLAKLAGVAVTLTGSKSWTHTVTQERGVNFPHNDKHPGERMYMTAPIWIQTRRQTYLVRTYYSLDKEHFAEGFWGVYDTPPSATPAWVAPHTIVADSGTITIESDSPYVEQIVPSFQPCRDVVETGMSFQRRGEGEALLAEGAPSSEGVDSALQHVAISGRPHLMSDWLEYSLPDLARWTEAYIRAKKPSKVAIKAALYGLAGDFEKLKAMKIPKNDATAVWARSAGHIFFETLRASQKEVVRTVIKEVSASSED